VGLIGRPSYVDADVLGLVLGDLGQLTSQGEVRATPWRPSRPNLRIIYTSLLYSSVRREQLDLRIVWFAKLVDITKLGALWRLSQVQQPDALDSTMI